jgi:hypothetical protein
MIASLPAFASEALFERGREAVLKQAGCHIVDYNFTEVEALKPGYALDERVYDTNKDKTTYELIVPIQKSPTEIRLQHVLFVRDLVTGEVQGLMKHMAEDWAYNPIFLFDFVGPNSWIVKPLPGQEGQWVRKVTNLDDGLRYQCAAPWNFDRAHPEWNCAGFAPIPGRETRDMRRRDYNTLDRNTRVIAFEGSWVERQENVKTIWADGVKTPLARELGRTWYVRQPETACAEAAAYAQTQGAYWKAVMEVWEEYYSRGQDWRELAAVGGAPRYARMFAIEDQYADRLRQDPSLEGEVKARIRAVIDSYRAP